MKSMEAVKVLGPTIMTGTSEVELGGAGARLSSPLNGCILGFVIQSARAGVATTLESDTVVVRLTSNVINIVPYEAFAQPINAGVGAAIIPYAEEPLWFPLNAPTQVGDPLKITGAELTVCTVHPYVSVTVMYADYVAGPQYHSQIGTSTAFGAAAQEYKMTTGIDIVGASWIKKIYGMATDGSPASGKGMIYKYRIVSTLFKHDGKRQGLPAVQGAGDIEFNGQFIPGMLGATLNSSGDRLTRIEFPNQGYPIDTPAHVDCYAAASVAFNAAGSFNVQIVWT
jgi:hypothetical protein